MPQDFGSMLRQYRTEKGRTLAALAQHLGVSTTYLWDMEKGKRGPWDRERILKAAAWLEVDPAPLLLAAAVGRGAFTLPTAHPCPLALEVGALLVARWEELEREDLQQLGEVLRRKPRPRKTWEEVRESLSELVGDDLEGVTLDGFMEEIRGGDPHR